MADPRGFLKHGREVARRRPVEERVDDWDEVYPDGVGRALLPIITTQAGRCMDCGIPFCHQGCPLGNIIPEWNDLVWRDDWDGAIDRLHATNNFPEFTGRLCPAPVRDRVRAGHQPGPGDDQERRGLDHRPGVGVGLRPAAAARVAVGQDGRGDRLRAGRARRGQQLPGPGTRSRSYERADKIGGLLRYGIPEFKMEKKHLDRRLDQMRTRGHRVPRGRHRRRPSTGRPACGTGTTPSSSPPGRRSAATCPRPGAELAGIHQAMEFLPQSNRASLGETVDGPTRSPRPASTWSSSAAATPAPTASAPRTRQQPPRVTQLEILAEPPVERPAGQPVAVVPDDVPRLLGPRGGW